MPTLLVASDLHGNTEMLEKVEKELEDGEYDALVLAGDYEARDIELDALRELSEEEFEDRVSRRTAFYERIEDIDAATLAVTGDWDQLFKGDIQNSREKFDTFIHRTSRQELGENTFFLIGWGTGKNLITGDMTAEELVEQARSAFEGVDAKNRVVVTHNPLYSERVDLNEDKDDITMLKAYRTLYQELRPALWICGHTKFNRFQLDGTTLINADGKGELKCWKVVLDNGVQRTVTVDLETTHTDQALDNYF